MTAFQLLVANSSLPVNGTFTTWDHLNNQVSGTNVYVPVAGDLTVDATDNTSLAIAGDVAKKLVIADPETTELDTTETSKTLNISKDSGDGIKIKV